MQTSNYSCHLTDDYGSTQKPAGYAADGSETAYLLSSPKNAKRIKAALEQIRKGECKERELIENIKEHIKN